MCHMLFSTATSAPVRINTNTGPAAGVISRIFNCMCTVAQIFIDCRSLRIKRAVLVGAVRLVRKFKQRINVPYPYHYNKRVPYKRTVLLGKNRGVPYRRVVSRAGLFGSGSGLRLTKTSGLIRA